MNLVKTTKNASNCSTPIIVQAVKLIEPNNKGKKGAQYGKKE